MQNLFNDLRSFRLSGIVNSLNERIIYAQNNKLGFKEFLSLLCEDEKSNRKDNNYRRRKSAAKLPVTKNLEDFDFNFQPSVDAKVISDLSTCDYINTKGNVIFIGDSETGKTHLAIGLALKALTREYSVYFTTVSDMLYNLHIARADNSYHKKVKLLLSFDLLILDELGFKQLPKHSVEDFFNIIAKRYENKSTIITTNKDFEKWNEIFADEVLTHAIIDRVVHHAHILNIKGKSYRINNYKSGGNMA
ncbi:IS21-like element helper ATPase IstB [Rickettsia endosymbiont of Gonocerus acuteangulatus]|uniref:IS21-like element helper ATPase IstB n=1 Tax=Rickettsia endosymbiont of Gonocerus acuteangulatus TaxID=3066266 RepID=UPI0031330542